MASNKKSNQRAMQAAGIYQIRVRGEVDPRWAEQLWEMQINRSKSAQGDPESVLIGRLADQSALNGVLRALYERQFPLISVLCLAERETT
jgi:hypothetical protein